VLDAAIPQRLAALYPTLDGLDPTEREQVLALDARQVAVAGGTLLFQQGAPCQGFPMVLSGAIRVARGAPGGRSLELYRVTPGELCVVSTACLFGQAALSAHGHATEPTEMVMLSPSGFERWVKQPTFRRFVFGIFADRLSELMALAEAVAFQRLDQRLAQALLGRGAVVQITHQALADELGTVREIVTRLLKRFERAGWVALRRERIELLDAPALRAAASGAPPIADGRVPASPL
jgi:CRP/FNR family transcriptional regulator, anaerobic regulatory protein